MLHAHQFCICFMRLVLKMSYAGIAEATGKKPSTLYKNMHDLRHNLTHMHKERRCKPKKGV
jgi:hypothetical protein